MTRPGGHGNILAARALLRRLAAPELGAEEPGLDDGGLEISITAHAVEPRRAAGKRRPRR